MVTTSGLIKTVITRPVQKLREVEEITLPAIANVNKETKIGYGIEFLPRSIDNLFKKSPLLIIELTETGLSRARNELAAVLEELLRQGGIFPPLIYIDERRSRYIVNYLDYVCKE